MSMLGVNAVMLPELDFEEQIGLCRELGVTHYQLRPRIISPEHRARPYANWGNHKFDLTPRRLVKEAGEIRRRLVDAGLTPFGTVPNASVDDSDESLNQDFEGAAAVGAGRVRISPLPLPQAPFDYPELLERMVDCFQRVVGMAERWDVKIVIETHARSLACSPALAWNICRHFSPDRVGVIFDINNFNMEGNVPPDLAVAVLRPYIDHVHIGGMMRATTGNDTAGFRTIETRPCPLDEADLHLPTWLNALSKASVRPPLVIESFVRQMTGADRLRDAVRILRRALEAC